MKRAKQTAIGTAVQSASRSQLLSELRASGRQLNEAAPGEGRGGASFGKEIRTIVVLLDGSREAEHALPQALAIARSTGASLRLVRAYSHLDDIDPWQFSQAAAGVKPSRIEKQHYLARIARRISRIDGFHPETVLIDSPHTLDALVSGAAGGDLVVIGSRRRRLASRLWWLNTVDQLRRRLSVPLLLMHGSAVPVDWTTTPLVRNVLVPLDGSVLGQSVLNSASQLARASGGSLTLLNVQDELMTRGFFEHTNPRGYLLSTGQRLQQSGVSHEAQILTTSRGVGQAIASYADSHVVDLIAIATHGDAGLSRLMRGSVADHLLRNTKLPILLQNVPVLVKRPEVITVS